KIEKHENYLKKIAIQETEKLDINVLEGYDKKDSGIFSFNLKNLDVHDIALQLDLRKICVRSGYHCGHSWFNAKKINGSVRASFYFYNTEEEVLKFTNSLKDINKILR